MDGQLFRQGQTVDLTIPATGKIAVFTDGKAIVSQISGPALSKLGQGVVIATVSAGVPYLSAAYAAGATLRINNMAEAPVYYNIGLTPGTLKASDGSYQPTPGTLNATGTLTAALILGRIVTSTTAAAVTATLDTGAVMDAAGTFAIGDSFDWNAIATGANAFTVTAAASGHTVVGTGAVATATSGAFRTVKTAAATFVTYRIS